MSWQVARPSKPQSAPRTSTLIGERWGVAHVVLSFGARNGGAMLAQWLRERLMERRGYQRRDNVYIDTIALQGMPGTTLEMKNFGRETAGGVAPINKMWRSEYLHAMHTAHTMIFLFTREWWQSPNCMGELHYWHRENLERVRAGRPPLRTLGVVFPDATSPVPGGMTPIRAERKFAVADPHRRAALGGNYREFYTMDDASLVQLMGLVGTP